ncbi:MAG: hypothetical protein COW30_14550 [Rhodospirillales bacterium CG15_BIG_FIL_POST_REV_8_21_14_020_66_15]|nr:MAG: hypothetical protein COW30_14550 [Rhodospirillales bacterium CG15_BIG_FIL_POST_REV_8_21_14_020_66_15]
MLRSGLLLNLDSLVANIDLGRTLITGTDEIIRNVYGRVGETLSTNLAAIRETFSRRVSIIEDFKSDNAILRNSLGYFRVTVADVSARIRDQGRNPGLADRIDSLRFAVLDYYIGGSGLKNAIEEQVRDLDKSRDRLRDPIQIVEGVGWQEVELNFILSHARVILDYKERVTSQIEEILSQSVAPPLAQVQALVAGRYEADYAKTNKFKILLYVLAVALILHAAYILIRLRQGDLRLRGAIDSMQEGFALFDTRDRLVHCNDIYLKSNPVVRDILKRRGTFEELLRATVTAGMIPEAEGWEEEFIRQRMDQHRNPGARILRRFNDGTWRMIKETRTPEGGTALTYIDITDLKRAEVERLHAMREAENANRAKSDFLAAMSHDLRTPLNAIIGFSDVIHLQQFGPINERYLEYIGDIRASGRFLQALVEDILDLSAIEAGQKILDKEPLDAGELIAECMKIVSRQVDAKKLTLTSNVEPGKANLVHADRQAVRQVLLNLLSNAIKFTPQGGEIKVSAQRAGGATEIAVADTGSGIPAHRIHEIVKPFTREKDSHFASERGWGLGLAITKSLVEAHGGRLDIKSKVGVGTTVTVSLPDSTDQGADATA